MGGGRGGGGARRGVTIYGDKGKNMEITLYYTMVYLGVS